MARKKSKIATADGVTPKAVIYARYSCDNQREESIEGQMRDCQSYAARKGYLLVGEYIDRAYTGTNDQRPDFQRMLHDSANHGFDIVLVWKLDRFGRDREQAVLNKAILKRNGVRVESAMEPLMEGPEGALMESLIEGIAQYYSADLSQKVTRGMKENALKAMDNGVPAPLGLYVDNEHHYQIDAAMAPLVLEVFKRYARGDLGRDVLAWMEEKGIRSNKGYAFTLGTLNKLLHNRKYIGEYTFGDVTIEDAIPAIVPKELFDAVQQRLAQNARMPAHAKAPVEYLLTGKAFCGKCQTQMAGESGRSRQKKVYNYYKCQNAKKKKNCDLKAVRKDWLERAVVVATKQFILQDKTIDRIAGQLYEIYQKGNVVLPVLEKQLADVNRKLNNLVRAIEEGLFSGVTKQRMDELESTRATLENAITQEKIHQHIVSKEQIACFLKQFRNGDPSDVEYQKKVIRNLVNAVYVYDDHLCIIWNGENNQKTATYEELKISDLIPSGAPKTRCILVSAACFFFFGIFRMPGGGAPSPSAAALGAGSRRRLRLALTSRGPVAKNSPPGCFLNAPADGARPRQDLGERRGGTRRGQPVNGAAKIYRSLRKGGDAPPAQFAWRTVYGVATGVYATVGERIALPRQFT